VTVNVGRATGSVAMIVGLVKPLPPSYLDIFKYEGGV
jgi:hypothetical protein